ncbi:MAG TPA: 4-hydroxythreonine-4-phosphate dehydrogenase PdxA [Thermoanaerobaculia bacterium]|nr:4-hydroxythreonine-4-phosphate dehydrogenase PdxA [Thermoanaerobaculia bacterium]
MQRPLAISLGDPAGIGPEVVLKAMRGLDIPVWLFGHWNSARESVNSSELPELTHLDHSPSASSAPPGNLFIDLGGEVTVKFGELDARYGAIALDSIAAAAEAVEDFRCSALVTAPINKLAIEAAGATVPGHTELLAARSGLARYGFDYAMYFDSPTLRVVLLSVHLPLADAIRTITADLVEATILLTDREYQRLYGSRPRIGVAGVNPHAGESGKFGSEEAVMLEGVKLAAAAGCQVSGPHAPDTVFLRAVRGSFDVVVAAYHDQGLIPVKTLDFERSVNVTLGLPYLRCSVDHGTAFEIAGKGLADSAPMRYAIEWASNHASALRR